MTPQSTFMVAAPIRAGRIGALKKLLATMDLPDRPGMADANNKIVPFAKFDNLHFARFVILDDQTLGDFAQLDKPVPSYPVRLAFLGDCDGTGDFLSVVAEHEVAGPGLRRIFANCEGLDANADLRGWMKQYELRPAAAYVNWIGRTVLQIREEAALRDVLVKYVDEHRGELQGLEPHQVHTQLKEHARAMRLSPPA